MNIDRNRLSVTIYNSKCTCHVCTTRYNNFNPFNFTLTVLNARCRAPVPLVVVIPYLQLQITRLIFKFFNIGALSHKRGV